MSNGIPPSEKESPINKDERHQHINKQTYLPFSFLIRIQNDTLNPFYFQLNLNEAEYFYHLFYFLNRFFCSLLVSLLWHGTRSCCNVFFIRCYCCCCCWNIWWDKKRLINILNREKNALQTSKYILYLFYLCALNQTIHNFVSHSVCVIVEQKTWKSWIGRKVFLLLYISLLFFLVLFICSIGHSDCRKIRSKKSNNVLTIYRMLLVCIGDCINCEPNNDEPTNLEKC